MLIVLESLSPLERAAFVLTESFGMPSARAALRPIETNDKVARFLLGLLRVPDAASYRPELRQINGELAVVVSPGEGVDSVLFVTGHGDRVSALHTIRNPDKLTAL